MVKSSTISQSNPIDINLDHCETVTSHKDQVNCTSNQNISANKLIIKIRAKNVKKKTTQKVTHRTLQNKN